MIPFATSAFLDQLKGAADIIEEVSATLIYFGFCKPGTAATSEPAWSIMKVDISGAVLPITTQFLWANGQANYSLVWDNRAGYLYSFKAF